MANEGSKNEIEKDMLRRIFLDFIGAKSMLHNARDTPYAGWHEWA